MLGKCVDDTFLRLISQAFRRLTGANGRMPLVRFPELAASTDLLLFFSIRGSIRTICQMIMSESEFEDACQRGLSESHASAFFDSCFVRYCV
jgi:hypothetical protein